MKNASVVLFVLAACNSAPLATAPTGTSTVGAASSAGGAGASSASSSGGGGGGGGGHCSLASTAVYRIDDAYPEGVASGNLFDGGADLVISAGDTGVQDFYLFANDGGGALGSPVFLGFDAGQGAGAILIADVDGDGRGDLVTCDFGVGLEVLHNEGGGKFGAPDTYPMACFGLASVVLARNGLIDIAIAGGSAGLLADGGYFTQLTVLLNDGGGHFPTSVSQPGHTNQTGIVSADLNGDGWPDLVVVGNNGVVGRLDVYLGDGDGGIAPAVEYAAPANAAAVAAADFTGDGLPDVAVANLANGGEPGVVLYVNGGAGSLSPRALQPSLAAPEALAAADFSGDGRADLAVVGEQGLEIWLQFDGGLNAPAALYDAGIYGVGYGVVAADLNGDGRPDLALAGGAQNGSWLTVVFDVCQ